MVVTTNPPIANIYVELVRKPYFFLVHSQLELGHARYDRYEPKDLCDFLLKLFEVLSEGHSEFMKSLAEIDDTKFIQGPQHRRYVAKERDLLFIQSPHLEEHSVQFLGYWVGTNNNKTQVASIARLACKAANIPCSTIRKFPSFSSG
jgi:negative regulator of replication initiation